MNRHARRAIEAKARKTQKGLDQLGQAARKLKELETLPDALKDVQAILEGVNEMRIALACAIQDLGEHNTRFERLEHQVLALATALGVRATVEQAGADFDAAQKATEEEAPPEPVPET